MNSWHSLDKKEVFKELNSKEEGLTTHEAFKRLEKYGKNELKQISQVNPIAIFLQQFKSIFIIILLAAAAFSFFIKHWIDFGAIMTIILLNSFIGFFQQYEAEKTIAQMKNLLVPIVKVFRNNRLVEISSTEIVPGDIIQFSEGDKIMADCRIIKEANLQINEAILTGESFEQKKSSEILKVDTELANRENMLYMGTTVIAGNGLAVVIATGMTTEFGKIAKLVQKIQSEQTPLEKKMDDFSKKVAIAVVILSIFSIFIGIFRGEEISNMILTGVALAISVIPEGVPAIIAITLAIAIKRMQKQNALVRKLPAAETLGRTTVICTDKTGTLTEEKMTVVDIYAGRQNYQVKDNSFFKNGKKISPLESRDIKQLLKIGIMCNNARIEKDKNEKTINIIGEPTEKAFVISADNAGLSKEIETQKESRIIEYSFSSKRKLMSIIRRDSTNKLISYVKGAPDILIKKCSKELFNGRIINLTSLRKKELVDAYEQMAAQAMRVLGFAYKTIPEKYSQEIAEQDLIFVGLQGIIDPPRKEVEESIRECLSAGIKIKMITGDSLITAKAIGNLIGLEGDAIDEQGIDKLSEKEFSDTVRNKTIFARITPETKLRIIQELKLQKEIVAVTGDGVNDALALKEAHIGVAMGIRGSEVAREVSDIILLDDNFNSIVAAVKEGRRVYDNLKKSIKAHIAANVGELFLVLFALLLFLPLPILPLAILWMNLITDSLPSLALAFEPADKGIMTRKPINQKETLLSGITTFILIAGILTFIIAIGLFSLYLHENLDKARTITITTAIFCEMFIVLSCRSERNIWEIGWFSNKFLVYSIIFAIVLQLIAIYSPLANVFGFVPLSFLELMLISIASCPIFIIFEGWKFWRKK
ncbi:MAG: HAD-IC family P-type ATPase [archaeon]|nr:HAD-IC family P-type ATPase [archaeon]